MEFVSLIYMSKIIWHKVCELPFGFLPWTLQILNIRDVAALYLQVTGATKWLQGIAVQPLLQTIRRGTWAVLGNPFYLANLSLRTWTNINFLTHVSIGHVLVGVVFFLFQTVEKETSLSLSSHIS